MSVNVIQRAPCRIDLAGGTADLWPLYLYLGGLELVNMAIDVQTTVEIEWDHKSSVPFEVEIYSHDLRLAKTFHSLRDLEKSLSLSPQQNPLRWLCRVIHSEVLMHQMRGKLQVKARSDAPPGSGLGGSSVLGTVLMSALQKTFATPKTVSFKDGWHLQQAVRDLEAVEIEHPAGDQDYVPAIFGGLLILKLGARHREVEKLPFSLAKKIAARTALLYTGKPHHSGINNWKIFTEVHKQRSPVKKHLAEICEISRQLAEALRKEDLKNFSALINEEWSFRRKLSPAVNAPALDKAWTFAKKHGATARKACGAGGGGSILFVFDDEQKKKACLATALPNKEWRWLSTEPIEHGLCSATTRDGETRCSSPTKFTSTAKNSRVF